MGQKCRAEGSAAMSAPHVKVDVVGGGEENPLSLLPYLAAAFLLLAPLGGAEMAFYLPGVLAVIELELRPPELSPCAECSGLSVL